MVEYDIEGLFDNLDHELLMRAVKTHTDIPWVILYINRWLKAPLKAPGGDMLERSSGTPQGGVISPVLANLFLHYAFDKWMRREYPHLKWARYADDGLIHCRTEQEAESVLKSLEQRMEQCSLSIHPDKSKIIYCKDYNRKDKYEVTSFDFLGYTFRPRWVRSRAGRIFLGFGPAASAKATKEMRQTVRSWKIYKRVSDELETIAEWINPIIRGWINYYGKYQKSELHSVMLMINRALTQWARRKYRKMKRKKRQSIIWLHNYARYNPNLFAHWSMGYKPTG